MPLTREEKTGVVGKFQRSAQDTGSPEVQIALLSERINGLSQHFTTHKADHAADQRQATHREDIAQQGLDLFRCPFQGRRGD